jgi:hypothetical protein
MSFPCPHPHTHISAATGFKWRPFRLLVIFVVLILVILTAGAYADTPSLAAGIMIGQPTGLSLLAADRVAIGAAWSFFNHFQVHGDLWLLRESITDSTEWFLGLGGKSKIFIDPPRKGSSVSLGARVPVGIRHFVLPPLELFGEIAPGIQLFPSTSPDIDIAIGVRYHFNK